MIKPLKLKQIFRFLSLCGIEFIFIFCLRMNCNASILGQGTKDDPYLIAEASDLYWLADMVNIEGEDFKDCYFKQTSNIDLKGQIWVPIGIFGSNNYFYGVYDGDGHYVENLITKGSENNGFFGVLGGRIMNFGIESGSISGGCSGGISSHAASNEACIINCYNKADVYGARAGGIVDNFIGNVVNCWSDCKLSGEQMGGIASYHVNFFANCASTQKLLNSLQEGNGIFSNNVVVTKKEINTPQFVEMMNRAQFASCAQVGMNYKELNKWLLDSERTIKFSQDKNRLNRNTFWDWLCGNIIIIIVILFFVALISIFHSIPLI